MKALAVLIALCGPAVPAVAVPCTDHRWIAPLAGALTTAVGVPAGVALWRLVGRDRAATRRLEAVGVRATAEIRALTLAASDETDTCEVVMRISGPGLAPFEVRQNRAGGADMRVGARPRALVDPSDRSCAFPDRPTVR